MAKFVKLVEDATTYSALADVSKMQKGCIYEVEEEKRMNYQHGYKLKGIEGEFHTFNFEEVPQYQATVIKAPSVGERMQGFLYLDSVTGCWLLGNITSTVQKVEHQNEATYTVYTRNSVYNVEVVA